MKPDDSFARLPPPHISDNDDAFVGGVCSVAQTLGLSGVPFKLSSTESTRIHRYPELDVNVEDFEFNHDGHQFEFHDSDRERAPRPVALQQQLQLQTPRDKCREQSLQHAAPQSRRLHHWVERCPAQAKGWPRVASQLLQDGRSATPHRL
jgi:hypothetical protein